MSNIFISLFFHPLSLCQSKFHCSQLGKPTVRPYFALHYAAICNLYWSQQPRVKNRNYNSKSVNFLNVHIQDVPLFTPDFYNSGILYCSNVLFMVLLMFHHPTPTGAEHSFDCPLDFKISVPRALVSWRSTRWRRGGDPSAMLVSCSATRRMVSLADWGAPR